MRLSRQAVRRGEPRVLWVSRDDTAPHPYLVASSRRAGTAVRDLHWAEPLDGERSFGRFVEFGDGTGPEHPMSVKLVSPRMLLEFARAPEDVLVIYELGLVGLYAVLSKLFRPHKVVSLVEGDYRHIGRTGSARLKVALRRLAARFVDVFVANNPPAREYLIRTLKVPEDRIVVGWWLAGLPADLGARPPASASAPEGVPLFVCAGRLIPLKGTDLLIRALAVYRRQFGPCALWVIGDGPERESLVQLSRRLGLEDEVTFLGTVDHEALKGAFQACQAFVFPTLQDFVGRVVVEALTAGAPVVVSPMTGAVGTIVHDGVNGIVVDPRDASALAGGPRRGGREASQRPRSSRPTRRGYSSADWRGFRGRCAQPARRRDRRGPQRGRDPGDPRREGRAGVASVHAGDAAVLRPAVQGGQARGEAVRHDRLHRNVPHAQCRPPGGAALRRRGAGGLPGGLLDLLEGGGPKGGPRGRAGPARPGPRASPAAPHARDGDGGDPQGRRLPGRRAVLVPGHRAAPGGARPRPPLGRRPVRAGRAVGQRQPARHDPRRRHRAVQRVPGFQPQVPAAAAADPGRPAAALHRGAAGEDPGRHARPAARGTRPDQEQAGDRQHARRQQQQPRAD